MNEYEILSTFIVRIFKAQSMAENINLHIILPFFYKKQTLNSNILKKGAMCKIQIDSSRTNRLD
jgi:hypothetical protein